MNVLHVRHFAEVVDVRVHVQLIQGAEHLQPNRVIVVSVNGEHRESDLMLAGEIVGLWVVVGREACACARMMVTENVLVKDLATLVISALRWRMLMKEVAAKEKKVNILVDSCFKHLIKCLKRVISNHFILLLITQMVVS